MSVVTHQRACFAQRTAFCAHLLRFGIAERPSKLKGSLVPAEPPEDDLDVFASAFVGRGVVKVAAGCCRTVFCDSTTLPDGAKGLFPGERRMLFREGFWNSDESMPLTSANSPENFLLSPLAPILAKYFAGAQL